MTRSPDERLADILAAIAAARVADDRLRTSATEGDAQGIQLAFDAILHNLFVIGEAVKALPRELLEQEPGLPWREITAMRDVIGHQYHRIVPSIIHRTVDADLTPLESAVRRMRESR